MTSPRLRPLLALVVVVAAACGGGGDDGEETAGPVETSTTTVTSVTSPTTTLALAPPTSRGLPEAVVVEPLPEQMGAVSVLAGEPPYRGVLGQVDRDRAVVAPVALPPAPTEPGIAPLTGLVATAAEIDRPAILVKIDNTSKGRPQASLTQADVVYEEMIEGGFTRLAAVYHTNAPQLGPVRSGRTTDIALLGSLGRPLFAWSGANRVHAALLRDQDIVDLGAQTRGEYSRAPDRPGTYDLMVEATDLHEIAEAAGEEGRPPAHFEYRDETIGLPLSATSAERATIAFPSVTATWTWTGEGWARTQNGTEYIDADGSPVVAANVVVAEVPRVATGSVDTSGATVYEQQFLGEGRGWVLTDGHVVEVTWTKPSLRSVATWTTPDGVPVALTPGVTWVELAPEGSLVVS